MTITPWQERADCDWQAEIDELRAALKAQPVQEPVGYTRPLSLEFMQDGGGWARMQKEKTKEFSEAVYPAPMQQAPLTDEQIKEMSEAVWGSLLDYKYAAEIKFARAIEAAIKGGAT